MQIVDSTLSLTVADVEVTARFLIEHFGYVEAIAADGFASVTHPGNGVGVAIHRLGLEVLPADQRDVASRGVVLAFTVADAVAEEARLRAAGVEFVLPLTAQPWGERLFQVTDGNGVLVQVLDWVESAG